MREKSILSSSWKTFWSIKKTIDRGKEIQKLFPHLGKKYESGSTILEIAEYCMPLLKNETDFQGITLTWLKKAIVYALEGYDGRFHNGEYKYEGLISKENYDKLRKKHLHMRSIQIVENAGYYPFQNEEVYLINSLAENPDYVRNHHPDLERIAHAVNEEFFDGKIVRTAKTIATFRSKAKAKQKHELHGV